jgi:Protein of unknown function (DUF3450)
MTFLNKQTTGLIIPAVLMVWIFSFLSNPAIGWGKTDNKKDIQKPVEASIKIRQKSQQKKNQWEQEKSNLIVLYEQLKQDHKFLVLENKNLTAKKISQKTLNQTLLKQKKESIRIQKELYPFLTDVYARLEALVLNDSPFLTKERKTRLSSVKNTLKDPEITIAEKYRKVMEAVFVEAEYGSSIEVYQDKVFIGKEEVLGNIFRLGRVSLFFLSLDQKETAYYNVSDKSWWPLSNDHLPAIRSAVEIGSKRRGVELLSLPLGRMTAQGENQ